MKGKTVGKIAWRSAKECAFIAVFVALVIAVQLVLASVPGVEFVTVLFVSYAFSFGVRRSAVAATVFSLLRQLVFGFFPTVLILYLIYYNLLSLTFGIIGKKIKTPWKSLWWLTLVACICTICFSVLDNIITPLYFGYGKEAAKAWIISSLPFMGTQVVCTAVTILVLFLPLVRAFGIVKREL